MSRSRTRWAGLAALAGAAVAVLPAPAIGKEHTEVLDLVLTVVSLDGAMSTDESADEVAVTFSADVLFTFDNASLRPTARSRIAEAAARIDKEKPARVEIDGYTDAKGSSAYNRRLSTRRAAAVAEALRRELSGAAPALVVKGLGEADPVASNKKKDGSDNPRGRALNRRVTLRFGH
jgi:OOP family OmpA-OmpF porin